jgi:hypothetical protein
MGEFDSRRASTLDYVARQNLIESFFTRYTSHTSVYKLAPPLFESFHADPPLWPVIIFPNVQPTSVGVAAFMLHHMQLLPVVGNPT